MSTKQFRPPIVPMPQPDLVLRVELPLVKGGAIKPTPLHTQDAMRRYADDIDQGWAAQVAEFGAEMDRLRNEVHELQQGAELLLAANDKLMKSMDAVVYAQRERCAKLCEDAKASIFEFHDEAVKQAAVAVCDNLAARIRA